MLTLVPTPIGNLQDITLRALETLKNTDIILAEDTRTTGNLLRHYEIDKKLFAHHQHNEHASSVEIIRLLKEGVNICMVTDAGTPGISDPGFYLVRECIKNNIEVECLPGATAFVPALVVSGFPCDKFVFEGFLPQKKGRHSRLEFLKTETRTVVFYESPFRLVKALEQFAEVFGAEREVCVVRELSKKFEEKKRGTLAEVITHFKSKEVKGEIVIVLRGVDE
ncbi:MAG TPA: 16S rRNA (cytidine(1402)-2'-O)-methyltransferase [Bacteroidia bacterium]|nr:16S rRNA (cytidine(1402)-2'-O)-methyltransferase [Bacteroidia bacterium]HNU32061.1 16S rRNA (cytidine(1402)-2'-O)-methyltransferase [Bacteroidia bacterium]